ncbi:polysaccharide deacetylase family protein [Zooshikella harenae]|uniref:Polysaccharide deacetylase family protein n=1 Tax=Zooshikella harenae TaxID=2827238 RepID=A0ABS5ZFB4_9GAMM|nr:polysaccharide deacetylase family protein [Zooshikella harenae]MBU2712757.1 polysaccharide deacetylase family protein [Zooshikella harenae]
MLDDNVNKFGMTNWAPLKRHIKQSLGYLTLRTPLRKFVMPYEGALIFTGHRVLPLSQLQGYYDPGTVIAAEFWPKWLDVMQDLFEFISLDELQNLLNKRSVSESNELNHKKRLAIMTFDDGWWDTFEYTWPPLKARNIPLTLFLPTVLINTRRLFWWQSIFDLANYDDMHAQQWITQWLSSQGVGIADLTQLNQLSWQMRIIQLPIYLSPEQLITLADAIAVQLPSQQHTLSWQQVEALSKEGVIMGSHGLDHKSLPVLTAKQMISQLSESLVTIKQHVNFVSRYFCYPYGHVCQELPPILNKCGYQGAVTTNPGWVYQATDPYFLPRINLHYNMVVRPELLGYRLLKLTLNHCA